MLSLQSAPMKTCPFCAEEIQDAAIKCRWCGEMMPGNSVTAYASPPPLPDPPPSKPQQKKAQASESGCTMAFGIAAFVFIAFVVFVSIVGNLPQKQKTRSEQVSAQFSSMDGSHRRVVEHVKSGLKNPPSFEHVRTTYRDEGTHLFVDMTYRGTNGFGGIVTENYQANVTLDGNILGVDK